VLNYAWKFSILVEANWGDRREVARVLNFEWFEWFE
jgi:hypothetical protein